jgi:peptide/nickel transport system ATP-binding protein
MIKLENLTKIYSGGFFGGIKTVAVDKVNFEIRNGEIVSLVGESGSGKTTIGKLILRLIKPTFGRILFEGRDIREYESKEYYKSVQGVFQDPFASFNPIYKVDRIFENVHMYLMKEASASEFWGRVENSLKDVGLNPKDVLGKYPHQLSGGQLQRVLISRALLVGAKFLVADEIISMLDASTRVDVLNILGDLREKSGMSILFITHDLSLGYYISDKTVIMYKGSVVEMGDTEKVFKNPLHPYTKMLLESVPTFQKKWKAEKEIFKVESEILKTQTGCKYYDRCPFRKEDCKTFKNELFEYEENHLVSCIMHRR